MHGIIECLLRRRLAAAASILALGATLGFPAAAPAAEAGFSNFPHGAQTTYSAFVPAPGTTSFFGYALYIDASSVRDNNGDKVPGVSLDAFALAPRIVHTWNSTLFGWKMTTGGVLQGIHVDVKVPGADDKDTGPTLLGIEPLYLSRTFGTLTLFTGPLIYLPLGSYDRNQIANSNLNYGSFAYQASASWNPTSRWDVSLNYAIEFKGENEETNYESGNHNGLTFGVGYKPFADQRWDLGFSGFFSRQLTDDKIDGERVPGGGRTEKFAIGPKLVYWISPAAAIVAQWHHESDVENAPKGDLFWLECTFPL